MISIAISRSGSQKLKSCIASYGVTAIPKLYFFDRDITQELLSAAGVSSVDKLGTINNKQQAILDSAKLVASNMRGSASKNFAEGKTTLNIKESEACIAKCVVLVSPDNVIYGINNINLEFKQDTKYEFYVVTADDVISQVNVEISNLGESVILKKGADNHVVADYMAATSGFFCPEIENPLISMGMDSEGNPYIRVGKDDNSGIKITNSGIFVNGVKVLPVN